MKLFDRLTGRQAPAADTLRRSADEVTRALLALPSPELPYTVRPGANEGVDLVAEWRLAEPAWYSVFERTQLTRTYRTLMRLAPERCEVRVRDEQWEVTWTHGVPSLSVSQEHQSGIVFQSSGRTSFGGDPTDEFRFSSEDLKAPLRAAVLASGWAWRPVAFGSL